MRAARAIQRSLSLICHNCRVDGPGKRVVIDLTRTKPIVPPRASQGRKAAYLTEPDEIGTDGLVARLTDRVFENPAMSGGLLVMALTATAIMSNAMFLQSTRHPQPLFMTRPAPALVAPDVDPSAVPLPRRRADRTGSVSAPAAEPPLPRVPPAQRVDAAPPPLLDRAVVTDLQRALAERGLYKGAIDGISGSRTRAAISAYQKVEGLAVTGEPSAGILDHIRTASIAKPLAPAESPAARVAAPPPPDVQPAPQVATAPAENAAPNGDPIASFVESPAEPAPSQDSPAAPAPPSAAAPAEASAPASGLAPDPAAIERDRYLAVQHALNRIGYGPVVENGVIDRDTADAIRRFELDNGMPITGRLEERVVNRLIAIGALEAI
jgi:peptidoglycan hydrolase-like protein with peptidoglycan-binding domain